MPNSSSTFFVKQVHHSFADFSRSLVNCLHHSSDQIHMQLTSLTPIVFYCPGMLIEHLLFSDAPLVVYSIPVYHLGVPANLKAFIDRLGQTVYGSSGDVPPKFMKVIGVIAQGTDLGSGLELTTIQAITHALVMRSIPIAGDGPVSYIDAYDWTKRSWFTDNFERLLKQKDFDAETTLRAAESLGRRVAYPSLIVKNDAYLFKNLLKKDRKYNWCLSKIENDIKKK